MSYLKAINNYLQEQNDEQANLHLSDDDDINELCLLKYQQKIERDKKQGIDSKLISVTEGDKSKLLFLRDVRNINSANIDETYNYAGIGLNYLIAAKRMLLTSGLENSPTIKDMDFKALANKLIKEIHNNHDIRFLTQVISDFLFTEIESKLQPLYPNQDIRALLEKWAAWASLEMPTPAVATIHSFSTPSQKTFIQLDTPQTRLTPEIKEEWEYAKSGGGKKDAFHWFDHGLNDKEKSIAQYYSELILKEDRTCSAQLRDKIPGLKNAYEQLTLHYHDQDEPNPQSFTKINQVYHSATVVYVPNVNQISQDHHFGIKEIENEKLRLTKLGLKQQQFNADQLPMHYFTLNSKEADRILNSLEKIKNLGESNYYGVDADIVTFSQKAAEEIDAEKNKSGIFVSNFCLNEFRILFNDQRPGIQSLETHIKGFNYFLDTYKDAIQNIMRNHLELANCIEWFKDIYTQYFGFSGKGTSFDKLKVKVSNKIKWLSDITDRKVNNLEEMTIISMLLAFKNRILELSEQFENECHVFNKYDRGKTALYVGCASGDNRTGILLTQIAAQSMFVLNNDELMQRFVRAGHTQEMAGGSLCTCGIREKSQGAFPLSYSHKTKSHLIGKAAEIKSLPLPIKIEKNKQALKTKLEETKKNNSRFFHYSNKTEQTDPFVELEKTIETYLSPAPYHYLQPSEQFINAIVEYHLELKTKDDHYKKRISELDTCPIIRDKENKVRTKQIAERANLRILAQNFNKVLHTLNEQGDIKKKHLVLERFKKTVPEESSTVKFFKFISLAISFICPPIHLVLLYQYDKQDTKKQKKDHRIAGDFKIITNQLDDEYHRQTMLAQRKSIN